MRIVNPELMEEFRAKPACEGCGSLARGGLDPHHVFTRGAGQLDIRINLVALCRECHDRAPRQRLRMINIVARREGLPDEEVVETILWLRRLMRDLCTDRIKLALEELSEGAAKIAVQTLKEADKWHESDAANESRKPHPSRRSRRNSGWSFPEYPASDVGR